jgi:hypothetical protein
MDTNSDRLGSVFIGVHLWLKDRSAEKPLIFAKRRESGRGPVLPYSCEFASIRGSDLSRYYPSGTCFLCTISVCHALGHTSAGEDASAPRTIHKCLVPLCPLCQSSVILSFRIAFFVHDFPVSRSRRRQPAGRRRSQDDLPNNKSLIPLWPLCRSSVGSVAKKDRCLDHIWFRRSRAGCLRGSKSALFALHSNVRVEVNLLRSPADSASAALGA